MAIEFINSASTALTASSVISISRPSNSTAGDLLVAHIFIEDNTDRITSTRVPAGWSTAVNQTVGARAVRQYVHYKVLTTSEPSSYTWNLDAADEVIGMISAYRGADGASPIGNISFSTVTGASTAATAPEITVQEPGNWVVMCAGNAAGSTVAGSWVPPTSFTERIDTQTSTGAANISAVLADYSPASTGATGAKTYSAPVSDYYVASLIEIRGPITVPLTVTDAACVSVGETASLSQEQNLSAIEDGAGVQAADSGDLIQEHNLVVTDGASSNSGEVPVLEVSSPAGDIILYASDYISASAADNTTAQLTAPAGKDAGTDFQAGLISDDTNPLPAIDLGQDKYTEIEFCIKAGPGATGSYEFRITSNGTPLTAYLQTPVLTVSVTDTLTVADGYSVSVADTAALSQEHNLVLADSAVVVAAENAQLSEENNLSLADGIVKTVADDSVLEQEHVAYIADGVVKSVSGAEDLIQEHNLNLTDAAVITSGDVVTIGEEGLYILDVSDSHVVAAADEAVLSQEQDISVDGAAVVSVSESPFLVQEHNLVLVDSVVVSSSESAALEQEHNLVLSDGVVKSAGEDITISTEGVDLIEPVAGVVKTVGEVADLVQEHNLLLSDGAVRSVADTIDIISAGIDNIVVQDGIVKMAADEVGLSQEHNLIVLDSESQSVVDDLLLLQEHVVSISDSYNPNHADNIDLLIEHWLELSDGVVRTYGENVRVYSFMLGPIIDPYILSVTNKMKIESITPALSFMAARKPRTIHQGEL